MSSKSQFFKKTAALPLLIIAKVAKMLVSYLAFFVGVISFYFEKDSKKNYYKELALAEDRAGNVRCSYLFNYLLIKPIGYKFGNGKETISSVLGKNYRSSITSAIFKSAIRNKDISFSSISEFNHTLKNRVLWIKSLHKHGTLRYHGMFWCYFLEDVDKNHLINAIDNIV